MNLQLSLIVKELLPNTSEDVKKGEKVTAFDTQDSEEDANIGVKIIEGIVERMGYPRDFDPGPIEELRKSMKQSGIRAEDNEFSRAIIEEREK